MATPYFKIYEKALSKITDYDLATIPNDTDCLSLKEICDKLSISTATGRNWIKLGKLKPKYTENATPYFTKDYAKILKNEIKSGKNRSLKSRRNKLYSEAEKDFS